MAVSSKGADQRQPRVSCSEEMTVFVAELGPMSPSPDYYVLYKEQEVRPP